jgi:hypothetical protein
LPPDPEAKRERRGTGDGPFICSYLYDATSLRRGISEKTLFLTHVRSALPFDGNRVPYFAALAGNDYIQIEKLQIAYSILGVDLSDFWKTNARLKNVINYIADDQKFSRMIQFLYPSNQPSDLPTPSDVDPLSNPEDVGEETEIPPNSPKRAKDKKKRTPKSKRKPQQKKQGWRAKNEKKKETRHEIRTLLLAVINQYLLPSTPTCPELLNHSDKSDNSENSDIPKIPAIPESETGTSGILSPGISESIFREEITDCPPTMPPVVWGISLGRRHWIPVVPLPIVGSKLISGRLVRSFYDRLYPLLFASQVFSFR